MRKLLQKWLLLTGMGLLLAAPGAASAINILPQCANGQLSTTHVCQDVATQQGSGTNPITKIINGAIQVLSIVIGAASIIGIIASSIRMMTSGGDSGKVASAKTGIIYSLIGLAVVVLAQTIVTYVINKL